MIVINFLVLKAIYVYVLVSISVNWWMAIFHNTPLSMHDASRTKPPKNRNKM